MKNTEYQRKISGSFKKKNEIEKPEKSQLYYKIKKILFFFYTNRCKTTVNI